MDIPMHALIVDRRHDITGYEIPDGVTLTYLDTLELNDVEREIILKYQDNPDGLRWSLKSVWLRSLLTSGGYQQVIFVDPDMFFFNDPQFLFDELNEGSILLSPHWRSSDPKKDAFNFELNFRDGIYNGGFLGASFGGIPALEWLARACLHKCEIDHERGLFYDQKYFDLLPSRFKDIRILRHKGCNVANWNQVDCIRVLVDDQVLINGTDPVVFIHFTKSTILGIRNGTDSLLIAYLNEYESSLSRINPSYVGQVPDNDQKTGHLKKNIFRRVLLNLISSDK